MRKVEIASAREIATAAQRAGLRIGCVSEGDESVDGEVELEAGFYLQVCDSGGFCLGRVLPGDRFEDFGLYDRLGDVLALAVKEIRARVSEESGATR